MGSWLVPRSDLTNDQVRAVEAPSTEHLLIIGAPGSGKTLVLVHRAKHLAEMLKSKPDQFRILVYTKALRQYITSGAKDIGIPPTCIDTFAGWCVDFYKANISSALPRIERNVDFDAIEIGVLGYLRKLRQKKEIYDFAMVDEGQDLGGTAFAIITIIARHVTVCMDNKQQLYDTGSSEKEILKVLSLNKHNMALLEAYRCSPYVSQLAANYISDANERSAYLHQTRTEQVERETPVLYIARDWQEERRQLYEMVRLRQANGERVFILLPKNNQVFGFAEGLRSEGLEVETPDGLNFASDTPKIMTLHSAKGLTVDTVIMPRLVQSSFKNVKPERAQRLMFVGITRATRWVYMSTIDGDEASALAPLLECATLNCLTVRRGGTPDATGSPTTKRETNTPVDLLDIL